MVSTKWRATDVLVKLTDFGTARTVDDVQELFRYTVGLGTISYMAPECLRGELPYNAAVDIYSLGVSIWEIFTREEPWKNTVVFDIPRLVANGARPAMPHASRSRFPEKVSALIQRCWAPLPSERPTAQEVSVELARILREDFKVEPLSAAVRTEVSQIAGPVSLGGISSVSIDGPASAGNPALNTGNSVSSVILLEEQHSSGTSSRTNSQH